MSETRPRLEVVPGEGGAETPAAPRPDPDRGGRSTWILGGLLVLGLLLCAAGWIASSQEATQLRQSLAASEAALAETRADLGRAEARLSAFETHLGAARTRVEGLAREIDALGAFLAEGPAGDPSAD